MPTKRLRASHVKIVVPEASVIDVTLPLASYVNCLSPKIS